MNQWPNGQSNMFSQQAAMYSNGANSFDLNSPFAQTMSNGGSATPTQPFPAQNFQPGSIVPAKRPHDGMSGSPQQVSRSQTPNFAGYPNPQPGAQHFANAPNPFQHLQQSGSNNATPSPTMSNQQYRPPQTQAGLPAASPSPFPQTQPSQAAGTFNNQIPPTTPQNPNQGGVMAQQMAAWGQGMTPMANTPNMAMQGMPGNMSAQMNNNAMGMQNATNAQRAYQMKLLQHQQQLRASGMMGSHNMQNQPNQMNAFGGMSPQQQPNQQARMTQANTSLVNGQVGNANPMAMNPQQQVQVKRGQFLKTIAAQAAQQGRQVTLNPQISGRALDLYMLWTITVQAGSSQAIEQGGQWQAVANKLGFPQQQYPTAAEEIKQIYASTLSNYEGMWLAMRAQQKREQARQHAHQMAGLGTTQQQQQNSPVKQMMQPPMQTNQFQPFPQNMQQQGIPQTQPPPQSQPPPPSHATPVQAHAQLPQNGMTTPQQQMMQHRRNSSLRRPELMTPQATTQNTVAPSPHPGAKMQRSPSIKDEQGEVPAKADEPRSTNYEPVSRPVDFDGGYDVGTLYDIGTITSRFIPNMPMVDEMGVIDTKAITLSLASGIHSEVRYALDMLAIISYDSRISFDLEKCIDLIDVMIDCAEEQVEILDQGRSDESENLDMPSYEDLVRASRAETDEVQDIPEQGSPEYRKDRAADRLLAISTILRNFSWFENNHRYLTAIPTIKWISNTIRMIATRPMFLRTAFNTQDFYKDLITMLSNITQSLQLPSRDDALHILHFLLAFAPQPTPIINESNSSIKFHSYVPTAHRYLPPAVDSLAKLLARQDPNRTFYRSIFNATNSSPEASANLLTRAFGLAISVLPDRSKGALGNMQMRIVEARKAYLSQGMLAADILSTLVPNGDVNLARAWIESEDGWAVNLLNLAARLSVDRPTSISVAKSREMNADPDGNRLISHRALVMIKRLAERAVKSSNGTPRHVNGVDERDDGSEHATASQELSDRSPRWDGMPQAHMVLGALMLPSTDRVALGLLCGLHDMAMQPAR